MSETPRRVRFDLAYDGTEFAGWQVQPGQRTVQGLLERALTRLQGGRPAHLRAAGRTDAGVHAEWQVADCELQTALDDPALDRALAGLLPADLRVWRVGTAPSGFHPRKQAVGKTYRYRLDRSRLANPFLRRFALHHPHAVDAGALRDALTSLIGKHDWVGFAAAGGSAKTSVRQMFSARFEDGAERADFVFEAEGFLRHMVRNLVGTLLVVGQGKLTPEGVCRVLATGDRSLAGPTAPAHGLCLERVTYVGAIDEPVRPRLVL